MGNSLVSYLATTFGLYASSTSTTDYATFAARTLVDSNIRDAVNIREVLWRPTSRSRPAPTINALVLHNNNTGLTPAAYTCLHRRRPVPA
jgi:hypothetical protein